MTQIEYKILQSHYPQNASIILDKTSIGGIPVNTTGRIISINRDMNTVLVDFDTGQRISLIYGVDVFHRNTQMLLRHRK